MRARTLQAEARLLLNNPTGARALIRPYADRIYKIEGDRDDILRIMRLDCEAQASMGSIDDLGTVAVARAKAVARLWPRAVRSIASAFVDFIGFDRSARPGEGVLAWLLVRFARLAARARVPGGSLLRRAGRSAVSSAGVTMAGACLFLLRWGDLHWAPPAGAGRHARQRDVVVTRAMGGIGDLLIMTAGLRALSERRKTRVKLIVERKFFDLFRNNPYVEAIDIDGPPVDVIGCETWHNLTLCPAARYELKRRPFVRKGRAELFAAGMGVGKRLLNTHGWHVEYVLDEAQNQFCDDFLRQKNLGSRPLVGIQPYARELVQGSPGDRAFCRGDPRALRRHRLSSCGDPPRGTRNRVDGGPCARRVDRAGLCARCDGVRRLRAFSMRPPPSTFLWWPCSVRPTANCSPGTIGARP